MRVCIYHSKKESFQIDVMSKTVKQMTISKKIKRKGEKVGEKRSYQCYREVKLRFLDVKENWTEKKVSPKFKEAHFLLYCNL